MRKTVPHIVESEEVLAELLLSEQRPHQRLQLQALFLLKMGQAKTRATLARKLGLHVRRLNVWLDAYQDYGLAAMLSGASARRKQRGGRLTPEPELPAATPPTARVIPLTPRRADRPPATPLRAQRPSEGPRILLADSDEITASVIKHRIERAGGTAVVCADGPRILETATAYAPLDLILLTDKLPGISGFDLIGHFRADPHFATVPIIMLAWPGNEKDIEHAFQAGATDYLLKPFSPVELMARVRRLLPAAAMPPASEDNRRYFSKGA